MTETRVTLTCGCSVPFTEGQQPTCAAHGERRVVRVKARKPRFVAYGCGAKGPLVTHGQ